MYLLVLIADGRSPRAINTSKQIHTEQAAEVEAKW
jgi:hypothetical protein